MKKLSFFLINIFLLSCAHQTLQNRKVASNGWIHFNPSQEDMLPFPPSQCPSDTQLQSGIVDIKIQQCLQKYIHEQTTHGVTRSRICFPPETKHEARLLIPPKNKIYVALIKKVHFPTSDANSSVVLNLNHAYYSVEWNGPASLSAAEVKEKFRSTAFPKKVSLERCECDTSKFSIEECTNKLSPLFHAEQIYKVAPQENGDVSS